ncbi:hypothetical protein LX87_04561 [Larkinella arboricola]|uniref:Uncharacterized protein n=1 Tax=Larkinella arboricola TaxID=643671 RepID=A0A327WM86_LARAB|nr:hypothetical protein LX87_04561 [Larkinella arboricola]
MKEGFIALLPKLYDDRPAYVYSKRSVKADSEATANGIVSI